MEHNKIKNPNWLEVNQMAIVQVLPRIWTQDYREQSQLAVRPERELGPGSRLEVQYSTHSAMLPQHGAVYC